jgi:arylsulfatase A-like enzyme
LYAPEPYNKLYDPSQIDLPVRVRHPELESRQHPFLRYWLQRQSEPGYYGGHPVNLQALNDADITQMKASYYGLISEVDHHIGRLIDHLKASGEYDDTLIIFTVDHGEMLGDHWLWNKGGYFDASYHIPLIIRDPRATAARGRQVEAFTESVDLMPTILDWLGLDVPVQCDGLSLLPWLGGTTPDRWRDAVHWEYDFRDPVHQLTEQTLDLASDQCTLNVIRDEHYKYVHFGKLPPLLFDLQRDPQEFNNRADDFDYQSTVLHYAQKLLSLRMTHAERVLSNTLLTPEGVIEHRGPRS